MQRRLWKGEFSFGTGHIETQLMILRQETAIRKKRQERDAKFKKQAEAVIMKRERAVKKAENKAKKYLKETKEDHEDSESMPLDIPEDEDTIPAEKRTVINTSNLPDLLPYEYLQDYEETESLVDLELDTLGTKPKKMKFLDLVEKKPKDRKKGSTTYRISEVRSNNLAPKSSFHAKNTKESWLKGRGPISEGGVRKVSSVGFFKKR
jgi:U3 small nucleolar RNA-associated protein 16